MTDTKLLNWVFNKRVDITWQNWTCTATVYDDDGLPLIEESGTTVRHALREAYKAYNTIIEHDKGKVLC